MLWFAQLEAAEADEAPVERLVSAVPEHVRHELREAIRNRRLLAFRVTAPLLRTSAEKRQTEHEGRRTRTRHISAFHWYRSIYIPPDTWLFGGSSGTPQRLKTRAAGSAWSCSRWRGGRRTHAVPAWGCSSKTRPPCLSSPSKKSLLIIRYLQ